MSADARFGGKIRAFRRFSLARQRPSFWKTQGTKPRVRAKAQCAIWVKPQYTTAVYELHKSSGHNAQFVRLPGSF